MPEAYSKPCQITKMMRLIENHGIVRTVFSGILRHTQEHSQASAYEKQGAIIARLVTNF